MKDDPIVAEVREIRKRIDDRRRRAGLTMAEYVESLNEKYAAVIVDRVPGSAVTKRRKSRPAA